MTIFQNYGSKMGPRTITRQGTDGALEPLQAVYAQEVNGVYTLFLGEGLLRVFTLDTLPERLRVSLTMIMAHDWESYMPIAEWVAPLSFPMSFPNGMYDVGWRTSRFEYCFVMDQPLFDELRGMSVQKCTHSSHDSRGQSQSQGEEDS